jgi:DNA-binding response OmpR family regulator
MRWLYERGVAMSGETPTILVVEDDEKVRETYKLWLTGDFEVITAADGETALETIDAMAEPPVVVLLDRMMPGLSGKETLAEMRERDYDTRYAMVTAVEPDFDIIEMGFDGYLTKPATEEQLRETIASLREREAYEDALDEYTALLEKRETLRAHKSDAELAENDEYQRLQRRLDELDEQLDADGDDETFVATLRGIDDGGE